MNNLIDYTYNLLVRIYLFVRFFISYESRQQNIFEMILKKKKNSTYICLIVTPFTKHNIASLISFSSRCIVITLRVKPLLSDCFDCDSL